MIVIFEQDYDITNIFDVIDDDKFDDYVDHYREKILSEDRYEEILDEKKDSYGYVYKVKYSYPDNPVEWVGFDYVKFDGINNFINKKDDDS